MITTDDDGRALADRIDYLTKRATKAFDRMVEVELVEGGRTNLRHYKARKQYEGELVKLGQAMTEAVGVPVETQLDRMIRKYGR